MKHAAHLPACEILGMRLHALTHDNAVHYFLMNNYSLLALNGFRSQNSVPNQLSN